LNSRIRLCGNCALAKSEMTTWSLGISSTWPVHCKIHRADAGKWAFLDFIADFTRRPLSRAEFAGGARCDRSALERSHGRVVTGVRAKKSKKKKKKKKTPGRFRIEIRCRTLTVDCDGQQFGTLRFERVVFSQPV